MNELHKFHSNPTRKEIFRVWNACKEMGLVKSSHSFARYGRIEKVWGGWVLAYYGEK